MCECNLWYMLAGGVLATGICAAWLKLRYIL